MDLIVHAGAATNWLRPAASPTPGIPLGTASFLTEYHKHGRLLDAGTVEQAEDSAQAWLADTLDGQAFAARGQLQRTSSPILRQPARRVNSTGRGKALQRGSSRHMTVYRAMPPAL